MALLSEDRKRYPIAEYNRSNGKLRWDGSDAHEQLKRDIDEGRHANIEQLFAANDEYKKHFSTPGELGRRIRQELGSRKFRVHYGSIKSNNNNPPANYR